MQMNRPWMDEPEPDINYRYNGIENIEDHGLDLNMAFYRTQDPATGRWWQVDPKAEEMPGLKTYNAMGNNPISNIDPEGDIVETILIGAAIGAGLSAASYSASAAVAGNWDWGQFGRSVAIGAVGGGLSAGIGGAFAGTTFGQSTSFGILNSVVSNTGTQAAFGEDITLGLVAGNIAGGVVAGQIPKFTGVKGGSLVNGLSEIAYNSASSSISGALGGGFGAAIDGRGIRRGIFNGTKYEAIGGGIQAGLNILALGTTYVPDNPRKYGEFEGYKPVYRRGSIFTPYGVGVALGRNLVTGQTGKEDYDHFLRAHETGHFAQQRKLGFGKFYAKTLNQYRTIGLRNVYGTSGTLEYQANRYALSQIGYYYYNGNQYTK